MKPKPLRARARLAARRHIPRAAHRQTLREYDTAIDIFAAGYMRGVKSEMEAAKKARRA